VGPQERLVNFAITTMDCAGRAERRRRFGSFGDCFQSLTPLGESHSGVALRLPPQSITPLILCNLGFFFRSRPLNSNVHKVAFQLGNVAIYWYGVMMAAAFIAGLWTASRRGLREGVPAERILDIGPWLIVGALIGARTFFVVSYWRENFAGHPIWEIFMLRRGGLVYYGGLIGASLAFILYARLKRLPLWKGADILAPSIALGYFFGRLGCLMNGCCYGRECDLPWAIHFPIGHDTYPKGVHPTQIYESLLSLGLYGGLAWLYRHKKFDGQVFATYLVSYAVLRSFVEMFRGDYGHYIGGWITPAHLVSLGILITGVILFAMLPRPAQQSP
jgi:phosphatidylglycerol---prolipoprotein diacylglyceryl transferase